MSVTVVSDPSDVACRAFAKRGGRVPGASRCRARSDPPRAVVRRRGKFVSSLPGEVSVTESVLRKRAVIEPDSAQICEEVGLSTRWSRSPMPGLLRQSLDG